MIVNYAFAHSDNNPKSRKNGDVGASTAAGVCERSVARVAYKAFKMRCEAEGFKVNTFSGTVEGKVRHINDEIKQAGKAGEKWASVELHFNMPPKLKCWKCGQQNYAGLPCAACGADPKPRWTYGHSAVFFRHSWSSLVLTHRILDCLDEIMPWSTRRKPIMIPDRRFPRDKWPNNLLFPRYVFRPGAIIEAGFGCDPRFAEWIGDEVNQAAYGMAAAEGICQFYENHKHTPVCDWHK